MSVVRGRPPGLAGGIRGPSRAYRSSLGACPAPKSPTKVRLCAAHMPCLREGLSPSRTADLARVCPHSPEPHQLLERPLSAFDKAALIMAYQEANPSNYTSIFVEGRFRTSIPSLKEGQNLDAFVEGRSEPRCLR